MNLAGVDGFSLCRRINESDEFGKPVVFVITSLNDDGVEENVKKIGATEFFHKPLNLVELADAVKKVVG